MKRLLVFLAFWFVVWVVTGFWPKHTICLKLEYAYIFHTVSLFEAYSIAIDEEVSGIIFFHAWFSLFVAGVLFWIIKRFLPNPSSEKK